MPGEQGDHTDNPGQDSAQVASVRRRRSLRRAVTLACRLESDSWDGEVELPATDISDEGLWVETPYALSRGEELVVSFALPNAPRERVWAIAEVARVGMWRRRQDAFSPGMGLVFTYCSEEDQRRLRASLQGRPPRLPRPRRPPPLPRGSSTDSGVRASQVESVAPSEALEALPAVLDVALADAPG